MDFLTERFISEKGQQAPATPSPYHCPSLPPSLENDENLNHTVGCLEDGLSTSISLRAKALLGDA